MNVIIPLGGKGQRFKNVGYRTPKALIPVLGKEILFWVLDSFKITTDDFVTIIYNNELEEFKFEDRIQKKYNYKFNFIKLPFETNGPVETVVYGLNKLPKYMLREQLLIHDADSVIKKDILKDINPSENKIFYINNTNPIPIFSYIKINETGEVIDIAEKVKISDNANIGCYVFDSSLTFLKYSEKPSDKVDGTYISHIYKKMLEDGVKINSSKVCIDDFICLGTPEEVIRFSSSHSSKPLKFCFDLDNTLVTYPKVRNDYTTVFPIENNIKFLRYLKSKGHTIIIYTARRMLTHNGNVGKIVKDVGKITLDSLDKFNIPYDEIFFGKPHADFYIDDLSINPYDSLERETGFYTNSVEARSFNKIEVKENSIIKTSERDILGERHFYQTCPSSISKYFPKLINSTDNSIEIEKINGTLFSKLYCNKLLTFKHIDLIFNTLKIIHGTEFRDDRISIYSNYANKLSERYQNYDYSAFSNTEKIYSTIMKNLVDYEKNQMGKKSIIHGDLVFSNIFAIDDYNLKFIDMRGKQGDELSILGDMFYDYAKIYQSLIGYDFILNDTSLSFSYIQKYINYFNEKFVEKFTIEQYSYLKYLTASLLFTLIPLHNNKKCKDYYNLIEYLI